MPLPSELTPGPDHAAPRGATVKSYAKFAAEVAATIVAGVVAALTDQVVTTSEWVNVSILGLGAVAVAGAGNLPSGVWAYAKGWVASATAGAVVLQSAIIDGITTAEWLQVALAAAGAVGVLAAKGPRVYDAAAAGRAAASLRPGPQQ